METFFCAQDYVAYRTLMAIWCAPWRVVVCAYCPMPKHVHRIVAPENEKGLCYAIGEALQMRRHARTGRPLGNDRFILDLETDLGRQLHPKKPGPKGPRKAN